MILSSRNPEVLGYTCLVSLRDNKKFTEKEVRENHFIFNEIIPVPTVSDSALLLDSKFTGLKKKNKKEKTTKKPTPNSYILK